ncbi:hypothetical protein T4B_3625 [Trichinella pseudospiralis]|uniref:Uncharacterized protein n=1 Tax=Trichinella pseudospiralis TaxID=6337 RepID=A0A0V1IQQ2_TRIPS|nr:hypothetical protein T4B_3625 [Trichinella pseudospiralis]
MFISPTVGNISNAFIILTHNLIVNIDYVKFLSGEFFCFSNLNKKQIRDGSKWGGGTCGGTVFICPAKKGGDIEY